MVAMHATAIQPAQAVGGVWWRTPLFQGRQKKKEIGIAQVAVKSGHGLKAATANFWQLKQKWKTVSSSPTWDKGTAALKYRTK